MAQQPIIRVGDTTTHGGTVLEGFESFSIHGRAAAGVGHKVHCPQCKGTFVIVEGSPTHSFMGIALSTEGMLTSCGARLLASAPNVVAEVASGLSGIAFGPTEAVAPMSAAKSVPDAVTALERGQTHDQHFHLLDEATGEPLAQRRYRITVIQGAPLLARQFVSNRGEGHFYYAQIVHDSPARWRSLAGRLWDEGVR